MSKNPVRIALIDRESDEMVACVIANNDDVTYHMNCIKEHHALGFYRLKKDVDYIIAVNNVVMDNTNPRGFVLMDCVQYEPYMF